MPSPHAVSASESQHEDIGTALAIQDPLVRFAVFLFLTVFGAPVFSQVAEDPFAVYREAIEQQLAAIADQTASAPYKQAEATVATVQADSSDAIDDFARRFWSGRSVDVRKAIGRLGQYRGALESILDQEGVPKSLIAVVLVESGGQPLALSPKQARGLWQFIPVTAKQYGLVVTTTKDERVNVELSTRAAARYLRDLYAKFRDWSLALAAYNAGPDTIDRALQRGRGSTYTDLSAGRLIPEETRNYIPAVMSAMNLLGMQQVAASPRPTRVQSANVLYAAATVSN